MTGHIEQKLLALAEAATPGPWTAAVAGPNAHNLANAIYAEDETFIADCLPEWALTMAAEPHTHNMDFIAQCDPATVSRLARVVEAARALNAFSVIDLDENAQIAAFDAVTDALSALDATPEGGK